MAESTARKHTIDILFPWALFGLLAICGLLVLILAADIYQDTTTMADENYESRTVLSYLTEKIHQNDNAKHYRKSGTDLEPDTLQILCQSLFTVTHGISSQYHEHALSGFVPHSSISVADILSDGCGLPLLSRYAFTDIRPLTKTFVPFFRQASIFSV